MGGIKFDWLAVWVLSPDWLSQFCQSLCEAAVNGGGDCRPCPDFASYTLVFALQLRKIQGNTSVRVTERCSTNILFFFNHTLPKY